MNWCFAIINNLTEVYFEKTRNQINYIGHCYVEEHECKSKKEKECIKQDTEKVQLICRNGVYKTQKAHLKDATESDAASDFEFKQTAK